MLFLLWRSSIGFARDQPKDEFTRRFDPWRRCSEAFGAIFPPPDRSASHYFTIMQAARWIPVLVVFALSSSFTHAEKNTALSPAVAKPGKSMAEDAFAAEGLGKTWSVAKGEWTVKDGALTGAFKESDHHPAVLMLGVPNRHSIIQFAFKFDGGKGFALSYNSAKGHLFRVSVNADGFTVLKDRDKKDKKSKTESLAQAVGKITPGEWHTMLVEVKGTKVAVQTDTGLKASVDNSELDMDKTGYRFVTAGSVSLDDVKVWQAE